MQQIATASSKVNQACSAISHYEQFRVVRRRMARVVLNSLRVQWLLWIALPVAVSLLGMSLVEIRGHEQVMTNMVQQQAELVARSLGVLIDAHIDHRQGLLLQLASEYIAGSPQPAT